TALVLRSIHELFWVLLLIQVFGLGSSTGVLTTLSTNGILKAWGMRRFLCVAFADQVTSKTELRVDARQAANAAPLPPERACAAGAATARAAGSSLALRRQGSAHSERRLRRCWAHPG